MPPLDATPKEWRDFIKANNDAEVLKTVLASIDKAKKIQEWARDSFKKDIRQRLRQLGALEQQQAGNSNQDQDGLVLSPEATAELDEILISVKEDYVLFLEILRSFDILINDFNKLAHRGDADKMPDILRNIAKTRGRFLDILKKWHLDMIRLSKLAKRNDLGQKPEDVSRFILKKLSEFGIRHKPSYYLEKLQGVDKKLTAFFKRHKIDPADYLKGHTPAEKGIDSGNLKAIDCSA
jgi:hypothetical protein